MSVHAFSLRASLAAAAFAVAAMAGCYPSSNLCDEQRSPITSSDGGEARCVVAEDCARPENYVVCTSEGEQVERDCVACEETRCVRYTAEPCQ